MKEQQTADQQLPPKKAPMPTEADYREVYERLWKEHFMAKLDCTAEFAQESWNAVTFEEHEDGFEGDPIGSVDEELSYWTNDEEWNHGGE